MGMNAIFSYTVSPATIAYSVSDSLLSIVTLTITATNSSGQNVNCSQLSFTVPYGIGQDALTLDPTVIAVSAGQATPWAVSCGANGTWTVVPLPPATGLAAGASISFVFSNIVVNMAQGSATITIDETTDIVRQGTVTVQKNIPATSGGDKPAIQSFTANPTQVALGGNTTLAWQVANAQSGILEPGGTPLPNPSSGSVILPISQTTIFTLEAFGPGGSDQAPATVTVMPVVIQSFTANPSTPVSAGTQVTLEWSTQFASSCSIDQGIGPVPGSGHVVVTPQQTTIYTLTAQGLSPQNSDVTVTVLSG